MHVKNSLENHPSLFSLKRWVNRETILRVTILLLTFFSMSLQFSLAQTYAPNREEFTGPFASWVNVKTKYGAKGDGTSDDTQALQLAFDEIGKGGENDLQVLFLPSGTYRITAGLMMSAKKSISVIGADPATTSIKWDGAAGGIMFTLNGVTYSRFGRITWDGAGKANTAVAHFWDGRTGSAVTHNEHADETFTDVGFGLRGGKPHKMDAETSVLRCRFIRNAIAGISIESFNALDWYVWDSYFEDCRVGVTNDPPTGGAGNFHVFHSLFKRSTYADITIRNTMYFSVRDNYSIGSKAFFVGESMGQNGGAITLQRNVVIDPVDQTPIRFGNKGPITLLDNVVRSREGQTGPVVIAQGDVTTVGNTFTVNNAVLVNGKWITIDDVVQRRTAIPATEPILQATPAKQKRKVFELLPGWVDDKIQQVVDSAAALSGQRPVLHLRPGPYSITKPVIIPAGSDMQVIGDGYHTRIDWRGPAGSDVIRLEGGDKVVLAEFSIFGNYNQRGIGLTIKHSDQAGQHIFMEGVTVWDGKEAGVSLEGFKYTQAELHNFNHSSNPTVGVSVTTGKLAIFAGASSDNALSYRISNGGTLMAQDIWYESNSQLGFVNLTGSGNFTLNGARVYATGTPDAPVVIDNFSGKATFLGVNMNGKFVVKGDGTHTSALILGMQFDTRNAFTNGSPKAKAALLNSRVYSRGSYPLGNTGTTNPGFIRAMLQQVRNDRPQYKNASGLILHRLQVAQTLIGIRMLPATAVTLTVEPRVAPVSGLPAVVSLTLVNADNDRDIATLTDGYVINFAAIGTRNLNVRANTNPGTVGSVGFTLDGVAGRTERRVPYAIAGDANPDYYAWTPALGNHALTAIPYAGGEANAAGTALTINFSATDGTTSTTSKNGLTFFTIHPNPAHTTTTLTFTTGRAQKMDIVITNFMAVEVKRIRITVQAGENAVAIPVSDLQMGSYYVRLGDYALLEKLFIGR